MAAERAEQWVAYLPLAAALVVSASFLPLRQENLRFQEVKLAYRPELERLVGQQVFSQSKGDLFEWFIPVYLVVLWLGCVAATVVAFDTFVLGK